MLGLPDQVVACLFDLDGVLTPTAKVHDAAWAETFDDFLRERADRTGEPFVPFDQGRDYADHVDGRPRADGVRAFLASRGITLPEGTPTDPPAARTVWGLGNRKNQMLLRRLREQGIEPYPDAVTYLRATVAAGLRRAVVSSSANSHHVLVGAGLVDLVEVEVDGVVAAREGLRGKPEPDAFLAAARRLGVPPDRAAVFEDATAGVQAGRAGGFGCVVGVDRIGHADALRAHGATTVVTALTDLLDARDQQ